ncbi:hypothetical protein [Azospirillum canadense]|uniref:hypothetical protein n=1 Tax=Azospirillum canadense TaxID=403962 RepID=UPI0022262DD4|nr:hypothetical protein [Azospirillum canadense]MCW2243566.1 hypothetical protein [Azospirillum canadense]
MSTPDYRMTKDEHSVLRVADNTVIPTDERNIDYVAYLRWVEAGNTPAPYKAPPVPVPASISDRQFFQQLAVDGIVTQAEALAAVKTGDIPAALAGILDALPDDQRFAAEMLLSGATSFERAHPLSIAIGVARGMSDAEVDGFFRAAAAL